MKQKIWIIGAIIALLSIATINEANAHRWGYRRGYGYGYSYRPRRVWIAPPPPPVAYYGPRRYGYYQPNYYRAPHRGYYGGRPHYGYRRW